MAAATVELLLADDEIEYKEALDQLKRGYVENFSLAVFVSCAIQVQIAEWSVHTDTQVCVLARVNIA